MLRLAQRGDLLQRELGEQLRDALERVSIIGHESKTAAIARTRGGLQPARHHLALYNEWNAANGRLQDPATTDGDRPIVLDRRSAQTHIAQRCALSAKERRRRLIK